MVIPKQRVAGGTGAWGRVYGVRAGPDQDGALLPIEVFVFIGCDAADRTKFSLRLWVPEAAVPVGATVCVVPFSIVGGCPRVGELAVGCDILPV